MGESARTGADNVGGRARTAAGWQFLSKGINSALQMVTSIVLARLLMPADFGIVAMAALVTGLASVFRDLGLGQALVQRQDITPDHRRSAFWGTLVMALLLYGGVYLSATWVGAYFDEPRMVPVLKIIAIAFVLSPFAVVPRALLQRELDFRTPFFAELASSVAYGGVGITLALLGHGYWALVAATLAGSAMRTVALCALTRYLPPLVPTFRGIGDLYGFGTGITAIMVLRYLSSKADYFVVGRVLGSGPLGLYTRAWNLVHMPLDSVAYAISPVLFPAFASLQDSPERTRRAYMHSVTALVLVAAPFALALAIAAPEAIPLILGEQWRGSVLPTQIMCIAGVVRVAAVPASSVLRGRGTPWREVLPTAVFGAIIVSGAIAFASTGIWAVAVVVTVASVVYATMLLVAANRLVRLNWRNYLNTFRAPLIASVVMFPAMLGARYLAMSQDAGGLVTLVVTVAAGALFGAVATLLMYRQFYELKAIYARLVRRGDG